MQVNITGNVDVVISNGAFATFRAGYFHDRYTDTGIPQHDQLDLSDRRTAGIDQRRNAAGEHPGTAESRQHAACADHRFRYDEAQDVQRRLQPHVPGWRLAHAEGRLRLPGRDERRSIVVSRRLRVHLLGSVHRPRWSDSGSRNVWLLRGEQFRDDRQSRRRHHFVVYPGSMADWRQADAESRPSHRG